MRNTWIVAAREWKERVSSRGFIFMSILGPLVVLITLYLLFLFGGKTMTKWNVMVVDPGGIFENKLLPRPDASISYSFVNQYIEIEEFAEAQKFKNFDAMIEINEKVLSNKVGFVFYRELPSAGLEKKVQYQIERRLEEVLVNQFTKLSVRDFRNIKQPLNLSFRNAYDPEDASSDKKGWVGLFFGTLIFLFIALFGMALLRNVAREKSNRIVEIILASVRPNQLLMGKIIGVGMAALVQFSIWIFVITLGLFVMRQSLFPNYIDQELNKVEAVNAMDEGNDAFELKNYEYNEAVELVYERIQYAPMILGFAAFFVMGYFFYASIFAAVGASMGSESDGQQFVIPLIVLLCLGVYSGYFVLQYPTDPISEWLLFIPFSSPAVAMVNLAQGFADGESYKIVFSFLILFLSSLFVLRLSGRIYHNGLLHFGHRLKAKHLISWLRKKE